MDKQFETELRYHDVELKNLRRELFNFDLIN